MTDLLTLERLLLAIVLAGLGSSCSGLLRSPPEGTALTVCQDLDRLDELIHEIVAEGLGPGPAAPRFRELASRMVVSEEFLREEGRAAAANLGGSDVRRSVRHRRDWLAQLGRRGERARG